MAKKVVSLLDYRKEGKGFIDAHLIEENCLNYNRLNNFIEDSFTLTMMTKTLTFR